MTLKKLLKRVCKDEYVEIYQPDSFGEKLYYGKMDKVDPQYKNKKVSMIFTSDRILCINVKDKKLKRSTNNKAYKKWMKKYVKDHMDEIGLKDGEDAMD